VSFSRSGDREEKRGGGVDDAFVVEGFKVPERPLKPGEEGAFDSLSPLFISVGVWRRRRKKEAGGEGEREQGRKARAHHHHSFPPFSFSSPPRASSFHAILPPSLSPDCCMSGCVHCVYDIYASSLLAYQEALSQAHTALLASSRPRSQWPAVILEREKRGVAGNVKELSLEEMDPGMKAFLEMESRLKEAKKVKG